MRFMLIVKASARSEAGLLPSKALIGEMMKFNEEMAEAGVLIGLDGLHPSSKGARILFSNGKKIVSDGPFAETKELIGGYWLIKVKSKEEAIEWALKAPAPDGPDGEECEIEVRQVFDMSDFPADVVDQDSIDRVSAALQG